MLPREGTMVADRYRLRRKVGGGRVAATWQVHDEQTKSLGVLKLLHRSMHNHPEALRRFSLEAQIARELTGPYFAERIDSGSWQSMRYIAWRWHQGECLRSRFERNPKQDAPTVHGVVKDVCEALGVVHAAGYAHADLKPENVFFAEGPEEPSSQLKLLGFGVAFPEEPRKGGGSQRPQERRQGHIVGTPLYMSPDMLRGDVPIGSKADLWSLGVIVYEALTGRVPFLGNDLEETLEVILARQSPRPSSVADVPATLDHWWARVTEQQFSSAQEFSNALSKALEPALRSSRTQRSKLSPRALAAEGTLLASTDASVIRNIDSGVPAMQTEPSAVRTELHAIPRGDVPRVEPAQARVEPTLPRPERTPEHVRSDHSKQALEQVRAEQAAARSDAGRSETLRAEPSRAPRTDGRSADELGAFAPLPPLTDFLASSKRTLMGIKPAQLDNKPRPTQQQMTPPVKPTDAAGVMLYRNIEISEPNDGIAPANDHHTVPFPRPPFAVPRRAAFGHRLDPAGEEQVFEPTARTSSKTMEHLPAFLLGGDRRHQWIAAAVVCTIAASVLLLTGRSSMTDPVIEQSQKSLTPEGESDFKPPFAPRDEADDRAPNVPAQAEVGQSSSPAAPSPAATSPAATSPGAQPPASAIPAPPSEPGSAQAAAEPRRTPAPRPAPVEPPRAAPPAPARTAPPAPAAQPARAAPASEPSKARPTTPAAPRPSAPATTPRPATTGNRSGGDPGEFDFGF
ncbi:MAG: serine/threonine-protein kinase [Polyangiaceae bacterium]